MSPMVRYLGTTLLILAGIFLVGYTGWRTVQEHFIPGTSNQHFTQIVCGDEEPNALGLDFSVAPPWLYYSYLPTILFAVLAIMLFVTHRASGSRARYVILFLSAYVLWHLNVLVQWIASYHTTLLFSWQLTAIFEVLLLIGALFAFQSFMRSDRSITVPVRVIGYLVGIGTALVLPTALNIANYEFGSCEGTVGVLWYIIYGLEALFVVWGWSYFFVALITRRFADRRADAVVAGLLLLYITLFAGVNISAEYLQEYTLGIISPIGMALFLFVMSYVADRYDVFDFRALGNQIFVYFLWVLLFSLFFIQEDSAARSYVLLLTVFSGFVIGILLIRISRSQEIQKIQLLDTRKVLEQANQRLQELDKTKSEILSFATHQMRSPLVSIKWGLETLLDESASGKLTKTQRDLIEKMRDIGVTMTSTVNDLLDISKIEQGGMVPVFDTFSLGDTVRAMVDAYQPIAKKKKLKLAYDGDTKTKFILTGDVTKIKQVIENLIDNAIKYTSKGSISVSIEDEGDMITTTVKDTGQGISPETQKKLFGKFSRGDSKEGTQGGSGLGLYLAKKIVDMHQGSIKAESEGEGQGSTFSFSLPIAPRSSIGKG